MWIVPQPSWVGVRCVHKGCSEGSGLMKVLVLGAGFGGLELTSMLSDEFGESIEILLIDKAEGFIFGFSKLDVMFGRTSEDAVTHPYRDLVKPGVRFLHTTIRSIDPDQRRVETDEGAFDGDVMVVALGADLDPGATPGLLEDGHEFYTVPGAFALRDVLADFDGGRVVVGVTSTPFKCPPAPSETALLVHDFLANRGLRDRSEIALVMPMGAPIPPSKQASEALLVAFAERGIQWRPNQQVVALGASRHVATTADGEDIPYDLFLGVPVHVAPDVVQQSGMCVDGWIPVDALTLETRFPNVYAVGDVTSVGTPKAGVFAEGQARVVVAAIIARMSDRHSSDMYDGHGQCYLEFGRDQVARVDVTFTQGVAPSGSFEGPSGDLATQKAEFGSSRVRRWFDRDWSTF
jgi:sulfide:quinone oxidoreductase